MCHVNHRMIRMMMRILLPMRMIHTIQTAHAGPNVSDIGGLYVGIINIGVAVAAGGGGAGWMLWLRH